MNFSSRLLLLGAALLASTPLLRADSTGFSDFGPSATYNLLSAETVSFGAWQASAITVPFYVYMSGCSVTIDADTGSITLFASIDASTAAIELTYLFTSAGTVSFAFDHLDDAFGSSLTVLAGGSEISPDGSTYTVDVTRAQSLRIKATAKGMDIVYEENELGQTIGRWDYFQATTHLELSNFTFTPAQTAPIPEPSSFAALAGLGVLGLAATRRRRAA